MRPNAVTRGYCIVEADTKTPTRQDGKHDATRAEDIRGVCPAVRKHALDPIVITAHCLGQCAHRSGGNLQIDIDIDLGEIITRGGDEPIAAHVEELLKQCRREACPGALVVNQLFARHGLLRAAAEVHRDAVEYGDLDLPMAIEQRGVVRVNLVD